MAEPLLSELCQHLVRFRQSKYLIFVVYWFCNKEIAVLDMGLDREKEVGFWTALETGLAKVYNLHTFSSVRQ